MYDTEETMSMGERIRNFIDKYLNKFISRKLLVFIVGTTLLCFGLINGEIWITLASFYLAVEGVKDGIVAHNNSKSTTTITKGTTVTKDNSGSTSTSISTDTTAPTSPPTVEIVQEEGTYDRKG